MESNKDLSVSSEGEDNSRQIPKRTYNFPATHIFRDEAGVSNDAEGKHSNKSRIWLREGDFDQVFEFLSSGPDNTRVTEKDIRTKLPFFK